MMTILQKQAILDMRAAGTTDQEIADQMGMELCRVKMFVSRYRKKNRFFLTADRKAVGH